MRIHLEGVDPPGLTCACGPYTNVYAGVQRRANPREWLRLAPGDQPASWTLDCEVDGTDVKGRHIQGPKNARFIYLSWGELHDGTFTMFRRAKLWLDAVPPETLTAAARSGTLHARLSLTDAKGNPVCAAVRPPLITWWA